jgi:hypothetical protein
VQRNIARGNVKNVSNRTSCRCALCAKSEVTARSTEVAPKSRRSDPKLTGTKEHTTTEQHDTIHLREEHSSKPFDRNSLQPTEFPDPTEPRTLQFQHPTHANTRQHAPTWPSASQTETRKLIHRTSNLRILLTVFGLSTKTPHFRIFCRRSQSCSCNSCSTHMRAPASRPGRYTPRGNSPRCPLDKRLGMPQSRSGRCGEDKNFLPLPGIESRLSSP